MVFHEYQRDPHSGAGNCVCGASERSFAHPHAFMPSYTEPALCVCAQTEESTLHLLGKLWRTPEAKEPGNG